MVSSATQAAGGGGYAATLDDPEVMLLAMQMNSANAQTDSAGEQIDQAFDDLDAARRELREAQRRALEAKEDAGFWGDVASVLGDDLAPVAAAVGAAALAVGTGGVGAPAAIALVAAGLTVAAKVGAEAGLDPKVTAALALVGAAAGVAAGNVSGVTGAMSAVSGGAYAVSGGATAAGGVAGYVSASYEADALHANGEARHAELAQSEAGDEADDGIDAIKRADRRAQQSTDVVIDMQRARYEARQALLSKIGGV